MTTIGAILAWRTEDLGVAARKWGTLARLMDSAAGEIDGRIDGVGDDELSGDIRSGAAEAIHDAGGRVRRDAALLARFGEVLDDAERHLTRAREDLRDAVEDAEAAGLEVDDMTGAVARPLRFGSIDIDGAKPVNAHEHQVSVRKALSGARSCDRKFAAELLDLHPPRRHMYVPGVRFGADKALIGLSGAREDAVRGVFEEYGRGDDAEVTVLDRTSRTTTIIVGDPAVADRIVTIVPGTGSSPEDLRTQIDKAKGDYGDNTAVAVMTYDAPAGLTSAASTRFYEAAAPDLQRVQAHLAENSRANLIVVGHSYGATVAAQATRGRGLHADGVVLAASPGAGRGIKSVDDMKLRRSDGTAYSTADTRERVTAVTTGHDIIRAPAATPIHGADPTSREFMAGSMGSKQITNGKPWPRKFTPEPHSGDYFPDFRFRRGVEAFANSLPGSGPGAGVGVR